jgi:uncharacterized repeat protein (TIGR03803 family)
MQSQRMQEHGNFPAASGLGQLMAAVLVCAALAIPASAQTFVVLHQFDGSDGANPVGSLVQGLDGKFYGKTIDGSANDGGTFFNIGRYGRVTTLDSFCAETNCPNGSSPVNGLVQGVYGTFYGTTRSGGSHGKGTVFKIVPGAPAATIHNFCALANCSDGWLANSLIWGWDGRFYGTSTSGGSTGAGTMFRLSPQGIFELLHSFCQQLNCPDGQSPTAIVQGEDGNVYGVAGGGTGDDGTVFKITPGGVFETLYDFCHDTICSDGRFPNALVWGTGGNLYGTTFAGGAAGDGTVFKITTAGVLSTLYSFSSDNPGIQPSSAFLQASDGNFYGTTGTAPNGDPGGAIFKITPDGTVTWLYVLQIYEGAGPQGLVQGTDGAFYGTAEEGGQGGRINSDGTVFRLDVGLTPFVRSVVPFGHVGDHVSILGTDMTDVTSVSFNGTPATIISSCETHIATTVPEGATSGPITVTTSTGTLTSNVAFTVLP